MRRDTRGTAHSEIRYFKIIISKSNLISVILHKTTTIRQVEDLYAPLQV